jgi:nucleoside-diphosphate-sugar epimerase
VPHSPYAVSKLAGEHYCRVYSELFGLETVCSGISTFTGLVNGQIPRTRP